MEKKYEFNTSVYSLQIAPIVGAILAVIFVVPLGAVGLKDSTTVLISLTLLPCFALCIMHFIVQRKKNSYFYTKDDFLCYFDGDTDYKCQSIDTINISKAKIVIIGNIQSISGEGAARTILSVPNAYGNLAFLAPVIEMYKNHINQLTDKDNNLEPPTVSDITEVSQETIEKLNAWGAQYDISSDRIQEYLKNFKSVITPSMDLALLSADEQALKLFPIYFDLEGHIYR